jgi:hypothetical protein
VLSVPVFIVRYEKRLQAKADAALAERAAAEPAAKPSEGFAPAYVAPRRLRIRSTAA